MEQNNINQQYVNNIQPQANNIQPQASGYQPQATNIQPQPSNIQPQPSGNQPQASGNQPQASGNQPQPSGNQPQPSGYHPQPSNIQPQPSNIQPQSYQTMQQVRVKLEGALLAFFILQSIYVCSMMMQFPDSLNNLIKSFSVTVAIVISSLISTATLVGYSVCCVIAIAEIVIKSQVFLRRFQISGIIAMVGNLLCYVIRQIVYVTDGDVGAFRPPVYYWGLFVLALFWTVFWSGYFVKSSRVYTFMKCSRAYIDAAVFFKSVDTPEPWKVPPFQILSPYQYAPQQEEPQYPIV